MASPASSGPAGSLFEGQVGAYYLLSLLAGGEPRGLPGTVIARVEFQRAAEGRHLDDVIVHAQDAQGKPAVLEIQVKRSITFATSDPVFKDVVGQIAKASRGSDFYSSRYELAIATAKHSSKIDGPYQDVLTWAREIGDAATFHACIQRPGSGNDDMRTFINTFRGHLESAGVAHDDEAVWALLRRFQILVFDFTAQGSESEALAKERAIHVLHADDATRAGNLWTTLNALALKIAASGGDRSRDRLLEDLKTESFRFAGERRFFSARAALAEASRKALDDIGSRVGNVMLMRHERITAVRAALDQGRYIEIRGDAGVGKSGILRHFAEQMTVETPVIVLAPTRTIPKGGLAMKAVLGFDGSWREFLIDLASGGGAILFIDNLDSFDEEERPTVIDLVRDAAIIPGFSIIATARRNFGVDEPSWLPSDALDRLGRATPVIISELSDGEIEELRNAAPKLRKLLTKDHVALDVARNLFRLSRLTEQTSSDSFPRTEIDMAVQWWESADGKQAGQRERRRVLRTLAEQALSQSDIADVSAHPPAPIEALITSGTLRDLGNDRMVFRHDVLREWAIANLLIADAAMIERLPFDRPASASLARGVELAARMMLERGTDGANWHSFLITLSRNGAHGSWRRAALLALVHSEIGGDLLKRASAQLLADDASVLRELIRTMKAVSVEPIAKRLAAAGADPKMIPVNLDVPRGAAWPRLIMWLLILGKDLPSAAIPDVVDVYTTWSMGTIGSDDFTPFLLQWLYSWLNEIEEAREGDWRNRREVFGGKLGREQFASLESDLRIGFLLFCNRTPELAAQYLQSLMKREHNDEAVNSVLKFRGALARAAPKELAEFTTGALIQEQEPEPEYNRHYRLEGAFGFIDHEFLPPSPNQGPFLELLNASAEHGLLLIRQLVDHAVSFHSRGKGAGNNKITIYLDGERVFPWQQTYMWSREKGAREYSVTSSLMALEAWAHQRIEAGESFDKVLADIFGAPGTPACYLLVAVDLLLSHWPKSREAIIPFLACPELLCIDRERHAHDGFEYPDIFDIKALQKEPGGLSSTASLKARPSRKSSIDEYIGQYAVYGPEESRSMLTKLLRQTAEKLGAPDAQSNLGDAVFMAVHALNLANPANWPEVTVKLKDGSTTTMHKYVAPKSETDHLKPMQEALHEQTTNTNMQMALSNVLDNPARSSPEFAAAAVKWAQDAAKQEDNDKDESWMREEAVFIAALVAVRDGNSELHTQYAEWIRDTFARAMQTKDDPVHRVRSGLRYNPVAIAFTGMILSLKGNASSDDIRAILEVSARDNPAAVHGFAVAASALAAVDERLPRAVLRCALTARIQPSRGSWDDPKKKAEERTKQHQQRVKAVIEAEIAWLDGKQAEPGWPQFPIEPARPKHRLRIPGGKSSRDGFSTEYVRPDEYVEHQGAALWIKSATGLYDVAKRPWMREIARAYSAWTMVANGADLDPNDDVDRTPTEWNDAYFKLLAYSLSGASSALVDELALAPIIALPDESFFDATTDFLRSVDEVYFNKWGLQEAQVLHIRTVLVRRMMDSQGWKWLVRKRSYTIEIHIAPALAVLFFNDYMLREAKCYLLQKGEDHIAPFLPVLQELIVEGPCLFLALVALNLVEALPRSAHLAFVIAAGKAWLNVYPDDSAFWIDNFIGRRLCSWVETILNLNPKLLTKNQALQSELEHLLAGLVRVGVPEARRLEEVLTQEQLADANDFSED